MNEREKNVEEYSIPYKQSSALKLKFTLFYIVLILFFAAGDAAYIMLPIKDGITGVACAIFLGAFAIFLLYTLIYTAVLKKLYIELTDEHIAYEHAFGKKSLKWNEIFDVRIYTMNRNTFIGIISKEKAKKRKQSFWTLLNDLFGGNYSMTIGLGFFPEIDIERLYLTIDNMLVRADEKAEAEACDSVDTDSSYNESRDEQPSGNLLLALVKIFWLSIAIGIAYGFSIDILRVNFIIIPVFGTIGIIYTYSKSYKEEKINFIVRIIVGLISVLQVFTAAITELFLYNKLPLNIDN